VLPQDRLRQDSSSTVSAGSWPRAPGRIRA
jgi:hypothetical protein